MILRYAGIPLLLEDPGFGFQSWLEQSLSLNGLSLFGGEDPAIHEGRNRPLGPFLDRSRDETTLVGASTPHVGIPILNYASRRPPEWRINTLWWPTGATRHSIGLFLADTTSLEEINQAIKGKGHATLELGEDGKSPKSFQQMYLLPPHPITSVPDSEGLFLLCLVDRRYYWGMRSTGNLAITAGTSWTSLLSSLAGMLGANPSIDSVGTIYGTPDPVELSRRYENAAMVLEGAAASVGMRVTLTPGGTLNIKGHATSKVSRTAMLSAINEEPMAGGKFGCGTIPQAVQVTFPKRLVDGAYFADGDVYVAERDTSYVLGGCTQVPGTKKIIHSAAAADYKDITTSIFPINNETLTNLANQIADDYVRWQTIGHDQKFIGMVNWTPTGYDDYVLWSAGSQYLSHESLLLRESGGESDWDSVTRGLLRDYDFSTRIVSHPKDLGVSSQLSNTVAASEEMCWQLTPCIPGTTIITKGAYLAEFEDKVVLWSDTECYTVSETSDCTSFTESSIDDINGSFLNCGQCDECAKLTSCDDGTVIYVVAYQVALFPDLVVGQMMKIDGVCHKIDDVHATCVGTPLDLGGTYQGSYFPNCSGCGCHEFIDCSNSQNVKYVSFALINGSPVTTFDLDSLSPGEVVLDLDFTCWEYLGINLDPVNCATAVQMNLEESYSSCPACKPTKIRDCTDSGNTKTVFTDLSEFSVNDVLKFAEDPNDKCWQVSSESVAFGPTTVNWTVTESYTDETQDRCSQCLANKYILTEASDKCSGGTSTPKVTDEDLASAVGRVIKYDECCWIVSDSLGGEVITDPAPITYTGPFDDHGSCLSDETVIVGKVVGSVSSVDATFSVDSVDPVFGSDPRSDTASATETVTFNNTFSQDYVDNDKIIGFRRKDTGNFETDKSGAETTTDVIHFELTQNMALAEIAKLAKPVDANGNVITGAAAFYVLDFARERVGKAPYTDFDTTAHKGYQGTALKVTDDYNSTGLFGYVIVGMERPTPFLMVAVVDDYVAGVLQGCNVSTFFQQEGRVPRRESTNFDILVDDPQEIGLESDEYIGQSDGNWLAAYDATLDRYQFVAWMAARYHVIKGSVISGVDEFDPSFQINNVVAVQGLSPVDSDLVATVTVKNDPKITKTSGEIVYVSYDRTAGSTPVDRWKTQSEIATLVEDIVAGAITTAEVPAASGISTSPSSGTAAIAFGKALSGCFLVQADGTPVIEPDPNFVPPDPQTDPPTTATMIVARRDALNMSMTPFASGIGITGRHLPASNAFVIAAFDMRSNVNFVKGTDPDLDMQIVYHEGGKEEFTMASEECNTDPPPP